MWAILKEGLRTGKKPDRDTSFDQNINISINYMLTKPQGQLAKAARETRVNLVKDGKMEKGKHVPGGNDADVAAEAARGVGRGCGACLRGGGGSAGGRRATAGAADIRRRRARRRCRPSSGVLVACSVAVQLCSCAAARL